MSASVTKSLALMIILTLGACGGGGGSSAPTVIDTGGISGVNHALSATVSGVGSVVSAGNMSCSSGTCSSDISEGATVVLTATPFTGWKLSAWSGACSGATNTCSVTMNAARSVTATFVVDTAAAGCNITRGSASTAPTVSSSHPKVFLNNAQTLNCLHGMAAANDATFTRLKDFVDEEMAGGVNTSTKYGYEDWFAALIYKVTGDTRYRDFAVARAEKFVASEEALIAAGNAASVSFDSYLYVGGAVGNLALVYDWCYDSLSPSQRTRWVGYMNQAVYNIWNESNAKWGGKSFPWTGWANDDPYNNYHYSFMRATMLVGLATSGDNNQAPTWINTFRTTRFENSLLPAFNANLYSGGSLEGTNYGVSMKTLFELYDWWERSTGERIADKTTHTLGSLAWMMHQVTPTTDYLVSLGDQSRYSTAPFFDYNREYMLKLIALYPQERLSSVANLMLNSSTLPTMAYDFESVWDFIYKPPRLVDTKLSDVSTAWYGVGTGDFMMRSAWADQSAAYGMIKCGWMAESHQHYEQGAFQIFRGDWLAPTGNRFSHSGLQSGVGSKNLVRFVDPSGADIEQTNRTGDAATCDMAALGGDDNYHYALAKVTPVYHNNVNISKSEREFVFIKPSTFVVFDRAVATAANVKRIWTLNLEDKTSTTISGNQLRYVSNSGKRMDVYRVVPAGLSYQLVDYPWADDRLTGEFPNATRVDVQDTTTGTASSNFLHVITTSMSSATSGVTSVSTPVAVSGMTGVKINLADGKVATLYFSNAGTGGKIEIKSDTGAVMSSGALPTSVTIPDLFKN